MKKILLLTLVSGLAIAANAQWHDDHRDGREAPYSNDRFDRRDNYYTSADRINRQFDERMDAIKYDRFLSRRERRHQLRDLRRQHRRELSEYREEFSHRKTNGYDYPHRYDQGSTRDRW